MGEEVAMLRLFLVRRGGLVWGAAVDCVEEAWLLRVAFSFVPGREKGSRRCSCVDVTNCVGAAVAGR
jgi:hypothetical protein